MNEERVFRAAQKTYTLYAAFFKAVVQEVGMEKALALHASAQAEQGIACAHALKGKMIDTPFNLRKLAFILRESEVKIGIESQVVPLGMFSVIVRDGQCPLYHGYRAGGLDEATAKALCQTGTRAKLGSMLKAFDPRVSYRLKYYRRNPDEECIEEISFHP